jgi:hypothetical protein
MNKRLAFCALAFALLRLAAARASADEPLEDVVEQRYEVDANPTFSVENIDGSIQVYTAEEQAIRFLAIKKAYTAERLQGIAINVKASRNSVVITTTFPPRKNALSDRSGTVDYVVVVPQTAQITDLKLTNGEVLVDGLRNGGAAKARLVNGWLGARNCFGNLDLAVETGRLEIGYDWWENHEFAIKAFNTRGNLRAIFPSDSSINLSATALEGRIFNAFESRNTTSEGVVRSVTEAVGPDAQAVVSLESRHGNIRIDRLNYY